MNRRENILRECLLLKKKKKRIKLRRAPALRLYGRRVYRRVFDVYVCVTPVYFSRLQKVGCDWVIDSSAIEDKCGVCRGDGTECSPVVGEFTETARLSGKISSGFARPRLAAGDAR